MNLFKKTAVIFAILSFFNLYFPKICISWQNRIYTKAEASAGITKHTPKFFAPSEKKIPVDPMTSEEKVKKPKKNKWLWVGLGVLIAGVLASAGGGGGGDGSPSPITGDIIIQWND